MGSDDGLNATTVEAQIRPYKPQDLNGLQCAWEAATRAAHPFFSDEFITEQRIAVAEQYIPNTVTDVALVDGAVVGFISMMGNEIGAIFVDPAFHGKGIGRALMDGVAALHETLEVEVFEKNAIGRPFYERYGFSEIGRSVFEQIDEELIRMRWER